MHLTPTLRLLAGSLMLVAALVVYLQTNALGFPDGHLTELDRALQPLAYVFILASVLAGAGLLLIGLWARKFSTAYSRSLLIGYLLVVLLLLAVRFYLSLRLDDGTGG